MYREESISLQFVQNAWTLWERLGSMTCDCIHVYAGQSVESWLLHAFLRLLLDVWS